MEKGLKSPQIMILTSIIALIIVLTGIIPQLSLMIILIPVLLSLFATLTDKKKTIGIFIVSSIISLLSRDIIQAIQLILMYILLGIAMGSVYRKMINSGTSNKFEPIYVGIIVNMISLILVYVILNVGFKIDMLQEYKEMIDITIAQQIEILGKSSTDEAFISKLASYMNNVLPTFIFIQSVVVSLIVYLIQNFIMKKMRIKDFELATLNQFYLPGNAVFASLGIYLFLIIIDSINLGLKIDLVMINVQLVFYFMFIVQGISTAMYYLKKWLYENKLKQIFMCGLVFGIFGVVAVSFLGMLDSMNDFRKVRNYKSI